jgi:hypothetical protein
MLMGIMMSDYKQIQKNTGLTPRTYDEAYNTPDYATAIWKYESDNKRGAKLIIKWTVYMGIVAWLAISIYAMVMLFVG